MSYYDEKDSAGRIITKKAELVVKQKGKKFTATNTNLDEGRRKWTLKGSIVGPACVSGTYEGKDPGDVSIGTFFLQKEKSGPYTYKGYWAGYDADNSESDSQGYRWRRDLDIKVKVLKRANEKLMDRIIAIFSEELGERYITKEVVEEILKKNNNQFLLGAFFKSELVAVGTASILSADAPEIETFKSHYSEPGGNTIFNNQKVGMLGSLAVKQEYQRKGIGAKVAKSRIEVLKKKGCTKCIAKAWDSKTEASSPKLLEALGFKKVGFSERHWEEMSKQKVFFCKTCKAGPCKCDAIFYLKNL